jgi:hypothetical protein
LRPLDHPEGGGGFLERWKGNDPHHCMRPGTVTKILHGIPARNAHLGAMKQDEQILLLGSVPSFDDRRVGDLIISEGFQPPWHYHLVDIEVLARGWLMGKGIKGAHLLKSSNELSRVLGVDPHEFERHTAMGDVDWTIAQLKAIS